MLEVTLNLFDDLRHALLHPLDGDFVLLALLEVADLPAGDEAQGVPHLVAEVATLFAEALVEGQVVAGRGGEQHAHADAVGAVFLHEHDGVGTVAERFAHLAAQLVAHDAGEVDVVEGYVVHILLSGHYHACHPEEDDVGGCDEVGGGVVVVDLGVAGVADAVEEGDRPEP